MGAQVVNLLQGITFHYVYNLTIIYYHILNKAVFYRGLNRYESGNMMEGKI